MVYKDSLCSRWLHCETLHGHQFILPHGIDQTPANLFLGHIQILLLIIKSGDALLDPDDAYSTF